MKIVHNAHIALGQIPIPEIEIDPSSRDDIPAVQGHPAPLLRLRPLAELASKHLDVQRMLGLSDTFSDMSFSQRTVVRNVGLLTPELLAAVNRLVAGAGLALAGQVPEQPLQARVDSFVERASN